MVECFSGKRLVKSKINNFVFKLLAVLFSFNPQN